MRPADRGGERRRPGEPREFAYGRADKIQQFDKGWNEAVAKGWTVVSMKNDCKTVFPPSR